MEKSPRLPYATYHQHRSHISLVMSHFFLGYLHDIHKAFEGDLAMVIVVGEIAHHNFTRHFGPSGLSKTASVLQTDPTRWAALPGCNAFSLANATGLPRETVRRKIKRLVELGWLARDTQGCLRITPALANHFQPRWNYDLMEALLATADRIREVAKKG